MIRYPMQPAAFASYLGTDWPAHFGSAEAEYDRLITDRVLLPTYSGSMIRLEGPDAGTFLQGMVSQDVLRIADNASAESWLLDASGRIEALLRIYRLNNQAFILAPPPHMAESVLKRLDRYHIMEDLRLGIDESIGAVSLQGPNHVGFIDASKDLIEALWVFPNDRCGYGGYDLIGPNDQLQTVVDNLFAKGISPAGFETYHTARIEAFRPLFGVDMKAGTNPMVYGAADRISATKGCYIGQETVAMTRDRGRPPRVMAWLRSSSISLPKKDLWLYAGKDQAVELTSTCLSIKENAALAIGIVKFSQIEVDSFRDELDQTWQILQHTYQS